MIDLDPDILKEQAPAIAKLPAGRLMLSLIQAKRMCWSQTWTEQWQVDEIKMAAELAGYDWATVYGTFNGEIAWLLITNVPRAGFETDPVFAAKLLAKYVEPDASNLKLSERWAKVQTPELPLPRHGDRNFGGL